MWKGVNYSPRYHSYWRMLYDWDQYNLGPTVDSDLAALSAAGFNMLHLYIWDRAVFQGVVMSQPVCLRDNQPTTVCFAPVNASESAGFVNPGGDPSQSANNQWAHLNDFVKAAEKHGLFVILDFASGWHAGNMAPTTLDSSTNAIDTVTDQYAAWIGQFIQYLCGDNHHRNILAWSEYWALSPAPGQTSMIPGPGLPFNKYSYEFAKLYHAIARYRGSTRPHPEF